MKIDWDVTVNNRAIKNIVKRYQKKIYDCAYSAATQILDEMEQDLNRIYRDVIKEYYSDYSPVFYRRNESLYDLLQIENDDSGLRWGFDESAATPFERGGGSAALYEHVFRRGWHGGATGTDRNGYTVRVPSWRHPIPWYNSWGALAEQAPRSPLEAWNQEVDAYKTDVLPQRYNALFKQQLQKAGFK